MVRKTKKAFKTSASAGRVSTVGESLYINTPVSLIKLRDKCYIKESFKLVTRRSAVSVACIIKLLPSVSNQACLFVAVLTSREEVPYYCCCQCSGITAKSRALASDGLREWRFRQFIFLPSVVFPSCPNGIFQQTEGPLSLAKVMSSLLSVQSKLKTDVNKETCFPNTGWGIKISHISRGHCAGCSGGREVGVGVMRLVGLYRFQYP